MNVSFRSEGSSDEKVREDLKCREFEKFGTCKWNNACKYIHIKACSSFRRNGTCPKGSRCADRHTRGDCPFWLRGICRNENRHECPKGNHDRLKKGSFNSQSERSFGGKSPVTNKSPRNNKRKRTSSSSSNDSIEDLVKEVKKVKETLRQIHPSPQAPRDSYFNSPSFGYDRGQYQQPNFPSGNHFQLPQQYSNEYQQNMTSYQHPSMSPQQYFPSGNQFGYKQRR